MLLFPNRVWEEKLGNSSVICWRKNVLFGEKLATSWISVQWQSGTWRTRSTVTFIRVVAAVVVWVTAPSFLHTFLVVTPKFIWLTAVRFWKTKVNKQITINAINSRRVLTSTVSNLRITNTCPCALYLPCNSWCSASIAISTTLSWSLLIALYLCICLKFLFFY